MGAVFAKSVCPSGRWVRLLSGLLCIVLSGGCIEIRIPDPDVFYVAFGDSTTAGASEKDYHEFLRERLGMASETFVNEGYGGETSDEGLVRLRELFDLELFPNAEVLLYWEGGNDITDFIQHHDPLLLFSPAEQDYPFSSLLAEELDKIQANIESAALAGREGGLEVYVANYFYVMENINQCNPLPFDILLPYEAERANAYIRMLNDRIWLAAELSEAVLVDVESVTDVLHEDEDNYFDCNHLSDQGNEIVADLFFDAIMSP